MITFKKYIAIIKYQVYSAYKTEKNGNTQIVSGGFCVMSFFKTL
jgi:hypothetical protein